MPTHSPSVGSSFTPFFFRAVTRSRASSTLVFVLPSGTLGAGAEFRAGGKSKDPFDYRRTGKVKFEEYDLNNFIGRNTPVADQAAFRIDVPAFLSTLTDRQRRMALDLAFGMRTSEAAEKYNLSPGRISQSRREFKRLFDGFFAE